MFLGIGLPNSEEITIRTVYKPILKVHLSLYNSPYGVCVYDQVKALSGLIETSPNWHGRWERVQDLTQKIERNWSKNWPLKMRKNVKRLNYNDIKNLYYLIISY